MKTPCITFSVLVSAVVLSLLSISCHDGAPPGPPGGNRRPRTPTFVVVPQHDIPWPSVANSAWPMPRHDPQGTGRSRCLGPQKGRVKFIVPTGTEVSDPAIGLDSVFYFVSWLDLYKG